VKYKKTLIVVPLLVLSLIANDAFAQNQSSRLKTIFTKSGKCLDVVNDGTNNQLQMADCGNFSGQLWKIQPTAKKGFVRLKTMFTGADKCLDIVNDGTNNRLVMAKCGNFSGQFWAITKTP
jgi:hypothetical protein